MCVSCREMKNKKELIRIVRSPEGAVSVDESGKASGRGAYLCKSPGCIEIAIKRRIIEKNLNVADCGELMLSLAAGCAENGQS